MPKATPKERKSLLAEARELGAAIEANPETRACLRRVLKCYRSNRKNDSAIYLFAAMEYLREVEDELEVVA